MRGAKVEVKCRWCKQPFTARVADRKRGWAKFCSKSCKAMAQEKRTHQFSDYKKSEAYRRGLTPEDRKRFRAEAERESEYHEAMTAAEEGWDGHKST